jgi:hypothetical protein
MEGRRAFSSPEQGFPDAVAGIIEAARQVAVPA